MRIWYKILDVLVYGHVLIAAGAAALSIEPFIITGQVVDLQFISLIFFGTAFLYSFHRYIQIRAYSQVNDERLDELKKRRQLIITSGILSGLIAAGIFGLYFLDKLLIFAIPGILGLLYITPLNRRLKRVRDLPYIKIILISVCWTWITLIVPLEMIAIEIGSGEMACWIGERFLFILGITIPFDIRDVNADRQIGLPTLVSALGIINAKRAAYLFLCLGLFLGISGFDFFGPYITVSLLPTYALALLVIKLTESNKPEYFFTFLIDGLIILHAGLILLGSAIT